MSVSATTSGLALSPLSFTPYDGVSDDLLTAGLGWDGLKSNIPPAVSSTPTAAELRRLAIYCNYRALVDTSEGGGYGRLFGPNVSPAGSIDRSPGAGKIAGIEALACCLDERGHLAAIMLVQIPANFDPGRPAIVVVPSPGSRGVYGGIAAGEWGLKRGFAVAHTDKGTGNGCHELETDSVVLIDGLTARATSAAGLSHFTADLDEAQRAAFNQAHPFRYAFKHAHSRRNPEKDWGQFVLRALEFAFLVLNERFAPEIPGTIYRQRTFSSTNTRVIAFSVSNGGGSVLAAAEQDVGNQIHGIVAIEPQVSLRPPEGLRIVRGDQPVRCLGRPLFDYLSLANLIQPCAAHAVAENRPPLLDLVDRAAAEKRARQLVEAGVLAGETFQDQARDALRRLHDAGWEPESDLLHASHFGGEITPAVVVTFANAYARAGVSDNLCGFSFATTTSGGPSGVPGAVERSPLDTLYGTGNGIPPTPPIGGIRLVFNDAAGGPIDHRSGNGDFSLLGAERLRALWSGPGELADRLRHGVDEVRLNGNLRGKPAILVHGRSDALLPVNHTSRPYFGMNQIAEGPASRLSYIEVENAQHFDAFLGQVPGYAEHWLPLHYHAQQALGLMWDHLEKGTALPPSQVVRMTPRGRETPAIEPGVHLQPISLAPKESDAIRFDSKSRTVLVPD